MKDGHFLQTAAAYSIPAESTDAVIDEVSPSQCTLSEWPTDKKGHNKLSQVRAVWGDLGHYSDLYLLQHPQILKALTWRPWLSLLCQGPCLCWKGTAISCSSCWWSYEIDLDFYIFPWNIISIRPLKITYGCCLFKIKNKAGRTTQKVQVLIAKPNDLSLIP